MFWGINRWIILYAEVDSVTHFDNFGAEHNLKEIKNSLAVKALQQLFPEYKQMIK